MAVRGFHAHIYFEPGENGQARALADAAHAELGCPVGHFHTAPIGPHPRGGFPTGARGSPPKWPRLAADGAIRPVIDRVLPLDRWREGLEAIAAGELVGKTVLEP